MKTSIVWVALAISAVVQGCGSKETTVFSEEADSGAETLVSRSKRNDGCTLAVESVTLSKATGGEIKVTYNFLSKSGGDWIALKRLSGAYTALWTWAYPSLRQGDNQGATGTVDELTSIWTLDASLLPVGSYEVKGFPNWYKRDGVVDGYTAACSSVGVITITN